MSALTRLAVGAAGLLISTVSAFVAVFKFVEWALGWVTMPANANETGSALGAFFYWMITQDLNAVVLTAVIALFFFGVLMLAWAIRRTVLIQPSLADGSLQAAMALARDERPVTSKQFFISAVPTKAIEPKSRETSDERQAKNLLIHFAENYIVPAFDTELRLQRRIIDYHIGKDSVLANLAWDGFVRSGPMPDMIERLKRLKEILAKNPAAVSFDELEDLVLHASEDWQALAGYPSWLCSKIDFDYKSSLDTSDAAEQCEEWAKALRTNFKPIRENPIFNRLYSAKPANRLGHDFVAEAFGQY